jgi:hypothetical protein
VQTFASHSSLQVTIRYAGFVSGVNGAFFLDKRAPMAYILLAVSRTLITVAETPLFIRQAEAIWEEAEHAAFVDFIAANPEAGDVTPDTGGVRKIRWARAGSGQRAAGSGQRAARRGAGDYFFHAASRPLYLLMVYAKGRQENLSPEEKRTVRKLAAILKGTGKKER